MFKKIAKKIPCTEKFLRWLIPRGIVVGLGLIATLIIMGYAPRVQTGIVEYKLVTGTSDQELNVLWLDTDGRAITIAEDLRDRIEYDDDLLVSQAFENRIRQKFTDIQYRASVRLCGTDRVHNFNVSREVFNVIKTNSVINFETEKLHRNKIRRIINGDDYTKFVSAPPYPDPNYMVQYMHE